MHDLKSLLQKSPKKAETVWLLSFVWLACMLQDAKQLPIEDKSPLPPATEAQVARNKQFWQQFKVKSSGASSSKGLDASNVKEPQPEKDDGDDEGMESDESEGETSDAGESSDADVDAEAAAKRHLEEGDHGVSKLETQDLEMACAQLDWPSPKVSLEEDVEGGPSASPSKDPSEASGQEVPTSQATTMVMGEGVDDEEGEGLNPPPKPEWLVLQERLDRPLEELTPSNGTDDAVQADAEDGSSPLTVLRGVHKGFKLLSIECC